MASHKTTIPDKRLPCPLHRVNHQFRVSTPNMLWVSDFTDVATWKGFVYVVFVTDAYTPVAARGETSKPLNTQPSNGLTAMHASPNG